MARTYVLKSLGKQVGIGVAGTYHATLVAFAKDNGALPYCIPNEYICAELGRFIRLPVPPTAIVQETGRDPLFASLSCDFKGKTLPPVVPPRCVQEDPFLATGLLLFDIWVANCDRHVKNFEVDYSTTPVSMNIFDHGHALFGYVGGQGEARLNALMNRLGISVDPNNPALSGTHRHCLVDVLPTQDHFAPWIERIKATPDFLIESVCEEALPYGITLQEKDAAVRFLKHRRSTLEQLIAGHRPEFKAILNWPLF